MVEMRATLDIDGMSCGHCVKTVRSALEAVSGVEVVDVQIGSAEILVSSDEALEQAKASVDETGFETVGAKLE
jgi:copper chaperone